MKLLSISPGDIVELTFRMRDEQSQLVFGRVETLLEDRELGRVSAVLMPGAMSLVVLGDGQLGSNQERERFRLLSARIVKPTVSTELPSFADVKHVVVQEIMKHPIGRAKLLAEDADDIATKITSRMLIHAGVHLGK